MAARRGLALRGVDLDEVLRLAGEPAQRAAAVGLDVRVDAAVAEDEAGGGEHRGVGASPVAQWAAAGVRTGSPVTATLPTQVERRGRSWQGGQGFDGALVVGRVPPLQELQEEDAQRQRGGEGHGHAPRRLRQQPPGSPQRAANTREQRVDESRPHLLDFRADLKQSWKK